MKAKPVPAALVAVAVAMWGCAAELPVPNGGYEAGERAPAHWAWWSRTDAGSAERVDAERHDGQFSARLRHDGPRDWAFSNDRRFDVRPGQTYLATAWAKVEIGSVTLAVVALRQGKTLSWDIGSASAGAQDKWVKLEAIADVPDGCDQIYLRFVGQQDTLAWVDDVALQPWKREQLNKPKVKGHARKRVVEKLDRGLVALPIEGGKVYLSWRLLTTDPATTAFNIYRSDGPGKPRKLNAEPITRTADFADTTAEPDQEYGYCVRPLIDGTEGPVPKEWAIVRTSAQPAPCLTIRLDGDHTVQKVGIADLDGDGRYDVVLKQPHDNIDPYVRYWKRSPDTYKLEAYRGDGEFLWRYDLGWAIERGIWYSPYLVYDLDGDGRAEVAVKTGEGDPRDPDGRVQSGPEHLTILDGLTGKPITQVDWPSREPFMQQARGYNYASRNQLGLAYLDGKTPCLLVARGTYNLMVVVAYELHDGKLRELWRWDNRRESRRYWGQGAHWMHAADVDADGRDEVILGSAVLDDNGVGLWATGLGHPDHCYVGDIDPARPGLEIYYGIERRNPRNSMCLVDARTGEILWGHDQPTRHIHASGLCADIEPAHPGSECYSGERDLKDKRWLRNARGEMILAKDIGGLSPRCAYWDADPQRELLRGRSISKLDGPTLAPRIEGRLVAVADILGDWREEIITSVPGELRIYATTLPATDRRPCLMQDPIYRIDVAHAAMGYYQVPMLSYDLASGARR